MSTRVTGVRVKDGKVIRTYRMDVSRKIGGKKKAQRLEAKWKAKSK